MGLGVQKWRTNMCTKSYILFNVTITHIYHIQTDDGSTQQKLDFRLVVNCRDFLTATPCNTDSFTQLLSDGELTAKYSKRISDVEQDFRTMLTKLCFYAHLHSKRYFLCLKHDIGCHIFIYREEEAWFLWIPWCTPYNDNGLLTATWGVVGPRYTWKRSAYFPTYVCVGTH